MNIRSHFKLNLSAWSDGVGEVSFYLLFTDITNIQNSTEVFTQIDLTDEWDGTRELSALINDEWEVYDDDIITDLVVSGAGGIIEFDGNLYVNDSDQEESLQWILTAMDCGFLTIGDQNKTLLILYRLNDEKDKLDKNLTFVGFISGDFKAPIGIKNIEIDVINYNIENSYNYVYIPKLKRYYYITNIQLVNKDYTHLILQEDVLMSWKDLIKSQKMQITRYEFSDQDFIIDERLPLESRYQVTYHPLDDTTNNSLVNCTLNYAPTGSKRNYLITTVTVRIADNETTVYGAPKPSGTLLPDISPRKPYNKHYFALSYAEYVYFVNACLKNTNLVDSYIVNCLWLPFVPNESSAFYIKSGTNTLKVGDALALVTRDNGTFGNDVHDTYIAVDEILNGICPYLVTRDFTFPSADDFLNYAPYMEFEIYIQFVGWVKLDMTQLFGKRCIIYYTIDFESGTATAFLYSVTSNKLIFSQQCQMSLVCDLLSSNHWENEQQKMMIGINMTFSAISQGISAVANGYTGQYAKMANNFVGAGKSMAMAEMQTNLIKDKMSSTVGSPENNLFTPNHNFLRVYYRSVIEQPEHEGEWNLDAYYHLQGKPYNKYFNDDEAVSLSGYVEVGIIHFNAKGQNIYSDEITEIVQLLQNGVIF